MTFTRALGSTLVGLALLTTVGSGAPASASPREPVVYDALGDSYASGYGVPPYDGPCGRSRSAYAVQLDGRMKLDLDDFVACAGATTTSLVSGGQLGALDGDTDLVTLTVGGNDIGWSSAVTACLGGTDAQCAGALRAAVGKITDDLPALLDTVYAEVAARAPHAHVFVTGYPRLFSPEYGAFLFASPAEQQAMNDGADVLDAVLARAAAAHGFQFVDVAKRFDGHGVNSPETWLRGPFEPGPFHPDEDGYEAYTAAVTAAIVPARLG
jgi:lysophospholipase L1-like esterase